MALVPLLMLNYQQIYLFDRIQTNQTGDELYGDINPYKVNSVTRKNRLISIKVAQKMTDFDIFTKNS